MELELGLLARREYVGGAEKRGAVFLQLQTDVTGDCRCTGISSKKYDVKGAQVRQADLPLTDFGLLHCPK